jgi:biopolymer transport protein ExbD
MPVEAELPPAGVGQEWDRTPAALARPAATEHSLLLVRPVKRRSEDLIDMTAMVDIVFFLLIFFMVTSMQSLEAVIGLPTPQAQASATANVADFANDPNYITVTIYEDDAVWVEDQEVFGAQDLRTRLRAARKDDELLTGMLVVGSPDASHGTFVTVRDAGADAGLSELMFSVPDELEPLATGG